MTEGEGRRKGKEEWRKREGIVEGEEGRGRWKMKEKEGTDD